MDQLIITCPHCDQFIIISQLNCKIFRHAVYIDTGIQVHPHLSKNECDTLVLSNKVYGCCKPFGLVMQNNAYVAVICDYI